MEITNKKQKNGELYEKDQVIEKTEENINRKIISALEEKVKGLSETSKQENLESVLSEIPVSDIILENRMIRDIKKKTNIPINYLRKLLIDVRNKNRVNIVNRKFVSLRKNANKGIEYFKFNDLIIENGNDEILVIDNNKIKTKIADFSVDILFKTIDVQNNDVELFTFYVKKTYFYNISISRFMKIFKDKLYKESFGRDIVKNVFNEKSKEPNFPVKQGKYILGFDDGWILPLDDINNDYSIICHTDEQMNVLKKCRKMYVEYSPNEKKIIQKQLKEMIKRTQIPKGQLTIILAYCIIAPFRSFFIKNFFLFPHLILEGVTRAGKSSLLDFFGNDFYGHYDNHMSGGTASSPARLEDALTASTFPRVIDEFTDDKEITINLLKELATSSSDYKRKTSAIQQISRPKITPIIISSNKLGNYFKDAANNARAIVLNFTTTASTDMRWGDLKRTLKSKKLFSLVYDYTKNWRNDDIQDFINEAIGIKGKSVKQIMKKLLKTKIEIQYPRIIEMYKIIMAGVYLYKKVFDIELDIKNTLLILMKSRRKTLETLLEKFVTFCRAAIAYNPTDSSSISRYYRYLDHRLEAKVKKGNLISYVFTSNNLANFNQYLIKFGDGKKYSSLLELSELLIIGCQNKKLIKTGTVYLNKERVWAMSIEKEFIENGIVEKSRANLTDLTHLREEFLNTMKKSSFITLQDEKYNKKMKKKIDDEDLKKAEVTNQDLTVDESEIKKKMNLEAEHALKNDPNSPEFNLGKDNNNLDKIKKKTSKKND